MADNSFARSFAMFSRASVPTKQEQVAGLSYDKQEEIKQKTGMYIDDARESAALEADALNLSTQEMQLIYGRDRVRALQDRNLEAQQNIAAKGIRRTLPEHVQDAGVAVGEGVVGLVEGLYALSGKFGPSYIGDKLGQILTGESAYEKNLGYLSDLREWVGKGFSEASQANRRAVQSDKAERNRQDSAQYAIDLAEGDSMADLKQMGRETANAFNATLSNSTELANSAIGQIPQLALALPAKAAGAAGAGALALRTLGKQVGQAEARAILADATNVVGRKALEEASSRGFKNAMGVMVGATEGGSAGAQTYNDIIKLDEKTLENQSLEYREMRKAGVSHEEARRSLAEKSSLIAMGISAPVAALTGRAFSGFEANPFGAVGSRIASRMAGNVGDIGKEMVEEGIQGGASALGSNFAVSVTGADDKRKMIEGVGDQIGTGAAVAGVFSGALRAPSAAKDTAVFAGSKVLGAAGNYFSKKAEARSAAEEEAQRAAAKEASAVVNTSLQKLAASNPDTLAPVVADLTPATAELSANMAALPEEVRAELSPQVDVDGQLDSTFEFLQQVKNAEKALTSGKFNNDPATLTNIAATAVQNMRKLQTASDALQEIMNTNAEDSDAYLDAKQARDLFDSFKENANITAVMDHFKNISDSEVAALLGQMQSTDPTEQAAANSAMEAMVTAAPEKVSVAAADQMLSQANLPSGIRRQVQVIRDTGVALNRLQESYDSIISTEGVTDQIMKSGWNERRSLQQYQREALSAMQANDQNRMSALTDRLGKWLDHQIKRVESIDATAVAVQADGRSREVPFSARKTEDGRTTDKNKKFIVHPNANSLAQARVWHADAEAMASMYNSLMSMVDENHQDVVVPSLRSVELTGSPRGNTSATAQQAPVAAQNAANNATAPSAGQTTNAPQTNAQGEQSGVSQGGNPAGVSSEEIEGEANREAQPTVAAETSISEGDATKDSRPTEPMEDIGTVAKFNRYTNAQLQRAIDNLMVKELEQGSLDSGDQQRLAQLENILRGREEDAKNAYEQAALDEDAAMRGGKETPIQKEKEGPKKVAKETAEKAVEKVAAEPKSSPASEPAVNAPAAPSQTAVAEQAQTEKVVEESAEVEEVEETLADTTPFSQLSDVTASSDLESKNMLKHGFKIVANAETPIGKFGAEASTKLAELFNGGIKAVQEVFGNKVFFTANETKALADFFSTIVPAMKKALNARMNDTSLNGSTLRAIAAWRNDKSKPVPWTHANLVSLYATNLSDQNAPLEYDAHVLEAMVIGLTQYMVNTGTRPPTARMDQVAKFLGKDASEVTPQDMKPFFEGFMQKAAIAELAQHINAALSLRANSDTTVDIADGLSKALAGDLLAMLEGSKSLSVDYYEAITSEGSDGTYIGAKAAGPGPNTIPFIVFKDGTRFTQLAKDIASAKRDFNKVMNSGVSVPMWSVGEAVKNTERNISGTRQKLSRKQKKVLQNHNNIPFYINQRFFDMVEGMGREQFLARLGYQNVTEQEVNKIDFEAINGKNMGLDRAYDAMLQLRDELVRHSEATGQAVTEIPVHFDWYITTNNRVMMNGIGPQSDKLLREVLSPNKVSVDLSNPIHVRDLQLAVAQALGVKTENVTHEQAIAEMRKRTDEGGKYYYAMQAIYAGEDIADALQDIGELSVREVNALQTYAEFLKGDNFDAYLAFELDGKTDGPVNAMGQFGLWNPTDKNLQHLARGGYFFNQDGDLTINTENTKFKGGKDLYEATSIAIRNSVVKLLGKANSFTQFQARAQLHILSALGQIERAADPTNWADATYTRTLAKQPMTSTGYAGSQAAIGADLAKRTVAYLAQQLTKGMQTGEPISHADSVAINTLIGRKLDLSDVSKYQQIALTPQDIVNMRENFTNTMGTVIYNSIQSQMDSTISTMGLMVQATNVQFQILKHMYDTEYEKLRQQRIAEGKIRAKQPLSRADEGVVFKTLEAFSPIFQLASTQEMMSRDYGLAIVDTEKGRKFQLPGSDRPSMVSSMFGNKFASDIARTNIAQPGVRAAALFNIATGDANMMMLMFGKLRDALNVWDGYEASIGKIDEAALDVNKAVYDSWSHDALETVVQNLERTLLAYDKLATKPRIEVQGFSPKFVAETEMNLQGLLAELKARHAATKVVKEALQKAPSSVDHMSGGMKPYLKNQGADLLDMNKVRLQARQAGIESLNKQESNAPITDPLIKETTASQRTFTKDELVKMLDGADMNMVQKYLWSVVKKLVPNNLIVRYGNEQKLAEQLAKDYPGKQFPANSRGVFVGNTIYVTNNSVETILHETIHAALQDVLNRAYNYAGTGLTGDQKAAAAALEQMAAEFSTIPYNTMPAVTADVFEQVQNVVKTYMDQGNTYKAVQEMIAWTTNNRVSDLLAKRSLPKKLAKIIGNIVDAVRRMLGLNKNAVSWLEGMLSKVTVLADTNAVDDNDPMSPLSQIDPTDERLGVLTERMNQAVDQASSDPIKATELKMVVDPLVATSVARMKSAGFNFSPAQEQAYMAVQTAMALNHLSNPRAMIQAQELFDAAIESLSADSFVDTSISQEQAERKFNALFNKVGTVDGRSALLGNFMAMASTNDEVRALLQSVKPKGNTKIEGGIVDRIETTVSRAFDEGAEIGFGLKHSPSVKHSIDTLAPKLFYIGQNIKSGMGFVDTLNDAMAKGVNKFGTAVQDIANERAKQAKGQAKSLVNKYIDGVLMAVAAATSTTSANAFGDRAIQLANESSLPKGLRELIVELVGTTDTNEAINLLLNKTKYAVSHIRQRLREELPEYLDKKFSKPMTEQKWQIAHRAVGMTDAQSLLATHSIQSVEQLYSNDATRAAQIASLESQLMGLVHGSEYVSQAKDLARVMMGKGNPTSQFLARNAYAMSRLVHLDQKGLLSAPDAATAHPLLEELITLNAINELTNAERAETAEFLKDAGGKFVLSYLQDLSKRELAKSGRQRMNAWKGNLPTARDTRKNIRLAAQHELDELYKQGWTLVGAYNGDSADNQKLFYLASTTAAMSSFNQGAFQTAEMTVSGVNELTGRTIGNRTHGGITAPDVVKRITDSKLRATKNNGIPLLPIFGNDGAIVGYERMLDPSMIGTYTKESGNLAKSIGMWEGRLVEEALARQMNQQVADRLHERWMADKVDGRQGEFVNLLASGDVVTADAWNTLPNHTQEYLKEKFGKDGVMVRKDMLNNAVGYRSASVRDLFTGKTGMDAKTRMALQEAALSFPILGKNAYKYLVNTESGIQAIIGQAKDIIVVRSLVVGVGNLMANQLQLMAHGINPIHAAKLQARTLTEVNTHRRYEKRRGELAAELAVATNPAERKKLEVQLQALQDQASRLMIAPLIEAGELPTIAEGLTEQDEFSIISDFTGWLEGKTKLIPDNVKTVAKWATISKETPLYQGMNRMVQYGDFVAKMAVYDHLTRVKGLDKAQALREVSEEFVNYNFLPGRTRSYLESIGMTWFANYKLRIQKILLRHIRENPLRSLMISGGAGLMGMEHLFTAFPTEINYSYLLGPEPVLSAHESIMWNQLFN